VSQPFVSTIEQWIYQRWSKVGANRGHLFRLTPGGRPENGDNGADFFPQMRGKMILWSDQAKSSVRIQDVAFAMSRMPRADSKVVMNPSNGGATTPLPRVLPGSSARVTCIQVGSIART